ncbi:MAG TPA: SAM-dependent methyltransferase, partial [Candidatus Dormibacteraeota bacterium]|nr:SAM-dependent methyltransferase [Candidatus Dormibacteraeota bacterium]
GRLVELDPTLAARARGAIARAGIRGLEVREGDAGVTTAFAGAAPADLVLVCGVFGNITDEDIRGTIRALPSMCAEGATVIWTRHRRPPDLTPAIRRWFRAAGFEHAAFVKVPDSQGSVGVERFVGTPVPFEAGRRLFEFVDS